MGLQGNLDTIPLSDVLQWMSMNRKTGVLKIRKSSGITKKVFFDKGLVCSTASSEPSEYLGHYLISLGYITEEQLEKAIETQLRSGIRLGKILTSVGVLGEDDLTRVLVLKAEENLYELFLWEEGEFSFESMSAIEGDMVHFTVDVASVIFEGIRRKDDWERFREEIPNPHIILSRKKDSCEFDESPQGRFRARLFEEIDGKKSIADLELALHASRYRVMAEAYNLISKFGAVEKSGEKASPEEEAISKIHRRMLEEAVSMLEERDYKKALRLFNYLRRKYPSDEEISKGLAAAEKGASCSFFEDSVPKTSVLELAMPLEKVSSEKLTPEGFFLVSRVNGSWDINAILKISPMKEEDTLAVIRKLLDKGVLRVKKR